MFLIRECQLLDRSGQWDVRLADGVIAGIATHLAAQPDDTVVRARGGALLPGLQDHHIHLNALAAALDSLRCGPPETNDAGELAHALAQANRRDARAWLRGVGYHTCVAGDIDRDWLDRHIPDRPVRIQHRGGRLWLLNSAALDALDLGDRGTATGLPAGVERRDGRLTGRLYECDQWLRERLGSAPPDLGRVGALLASHGVTHVTDTSPGNNPNARQHLHGEQRAGRLRQAVRIMGSLALGASADAAGLDMGEYKIHLLESDLPRQEQVCNAMASAREQGRGIAVHCVTLAELRFTLDCFAVVGSQRGDRIEHASVVPPQWLEELGQRELRVVTQPHFIAERGDQYRSDVSVTEQAWLYRLRSFLEAGIPLAAGSDAPFGDPNPWAAMAAAVSRRTHSGATLGTAEALTPEQALALYTSRGAAPGVEQRPIATGAEASVCLLSAPWSVARAHLATVTVTHTWRAGKLIHGAA